MAVTFDRGIDTSKVKETFPYKGKELFVILT